MIVAFDNGLDGAICALSKQDGSIIDYTVMPTMERKEKREINAIAVREYLRDLNIQPDADIVIEEPLRHARSSQAVRSMAISFGRLATVAELMGFDPFCIEVHEWQRPMLGKVPKGRTKAAALKLARELEPEEQWLKNDRCRSPHDGIVDAYLIGRYCWETFTQNDQTFHHRKRN